MTQTQTDDGTIKTRQQATWASGNYAVVGTTLQLVGESLCEAVDLRAGARVLDVAAGNGNASLAAARRFATVVSTDYVPSLLGAGMRRAEAEGLDIEFREADAEALPFADGSFDAVLSTFGVMFAPDHHRAASEMLRVCRSGGHIGLANWTPAGFVGELFRVVGQHAAPPAGLRSPALWGTLSHLNELFPHARSVSVAPRTFQFRYRSAAHWLEVFGTYYGPVHRAFAALGPAEREALERDLLALASRRNRATDGTLIVPSEYVEVVIEKA